MSTDTSNETTVLQNRYLEARFAPDGRLIHLSKPDGHNLVTGIFCHCNVIDAEGSGTLVSEDPNQADESVAFEVVEVSTNESQVARTVRRGEVEVTTLFELPPESPLLRISVSVRGRLGWQASQIAFPKVQFASGFADAFEDERDCYFDGEEIGGGRELPCWRVFFKEEAAEGVLAATRSKSDMSHFQIVEKGFDLRPHVMNTARPSRSAPGMKTVTRRSSLQRNSLSRSIPVILRRPALRRRIPEGSSLMLSNLPTPKRRVKNSTAESG